MSWGGDANEATGGAGIAEGRESSGKGIRRIGHCLLDFFETYHPPYVSSLLLSNTSKSTKTKMLTIVHAISVPDLCTRLWKRHINVAALSKTLFTYIYALHLINYNALMLIVGYLIFFLGTEKTRPLQAHLSRDRKQVSAFQSLIRHPYYIFVNDWSIIIVVVIT